MTFRQAWIMECEQCGTQVVGDCVANLRAAHDRDLNGGWGWKVQFWDTASNAYTFCSVECEGRYYEEGKRLLHERDHEDGTAEGSSGEASG